MSGVVRTESMSEEDVGYLLRAPEGVPLPTRPGRAKGIFFALFAVFAVSPDAMLLRSMVASWAKGGRVDAAAITSRSGSCRRRGYDVDPADFRHGNTP